MSIPEFAPPLTDASSVVDTLQKDGFVVAKASLTQKLSGVEGDALSAWAVTWNDLPVDPYLKDGGRYRRRRHGSFIVDREACIRVAQRAHFQSPEYNALHGGMERWFEPLAVSLSEAVPWSSLLRGLAGICTQLVAATPWYVEAHQFRIDTSDGIGRPTPEGAHRDGVDFVALFMVARERIRGGETRVFDAHGPRGVRFTLSEPWSLLLLDDQRTIHESTPIQPLLGEPDESAVGYRDTLVLTFRRHGFQAP